EGYRKEGKIPAVLYGKETESTAVAVDEREFLKTVRKVGRNGIIMLTVGEGQPGHQVLVHDMQIDPLKGNVKHIDFFEVDMNQEIEADVAVVLEGDAPGAREGGVVTQLLHEITVRSLPNEIPEGFTVDISNLNIGDTILVKDLAETVSTEIINDPEEALVTVVVASSGEPAEESEEGAEPEVVGAEPEKEE
ncbi:MAG TPA: 50S ribosomal protein L25/general stress protein Ctc, partial [Bacilli bacterium]|nr:50S ribosomal protein L25/general stress protein Ctc [Bacilli bacterium]